MVVLATAATVIASQAVITGAYSLTRQAIQLGLLPRLEIRHTSETQFGQIYMPRVNTLLLVGVLLLVALFRSSSALASAYGIAVTGTMVVTAMMAFVVIWRVWQWSPLAAAALIAPFLFIDLTFLSANLLKVVEGGWVPLALGGVRDGADVHVAARQPAAVREDAPAGDAARSRWSPMLEKKPPQRVPGTAVFLTSDPERADRAAAQPQALQGAAREERHPHDRDRATRRASIRPSACGSSRSAQTFSRVVLRFGFMETPNVPKALAIARKLGWQFDIMSTSFFLSRRSLKPAAHSGMPRWQDRLFIALARARQRRHRLFPDSDRPRGRGRHPGRRSSADGCDRTCVPRCKSGIESRSCVMADDMARAAEVHNLTPRRGGAGLEPKAACCWSTCASRTRRRSKAIPAR